MSKIPLEDREFLRNNKQVFREGKRSQWMTLKALRKAVRAGKADDWDVVDINFKTGEKRIICAYCATGVEHPADLAASAIAAIEAAGRLH
jgi:hypothetical protein